MSDRTQVKSKALMKGSQEVVMGEEEEEEEGEVRHEEVCTYTVVHPQR